MTTELRTVTKQVYLDGIDISNEVYMLEYSNSEDAPVKYITIHLRDKDTIYGKREYLRRDAEWTQTRIKLYLNSIFMGDFFWESTSFNTNIEGVDASISGRSAVAILDEPYSTQITTVFENLTSKKALATTLCTSGITLSWLIPDSPLPAAKYGTDKQTPLEVINDLINACNGTLITHHDDTLVATYKEFDTDAKPSVATFDGKFDIVELSEDRTIPEGRNEIRIQSYESGTYEKNRPVVKLGLSKYNLKSDGADYLYATALCYKPSGEYETLTLYEDESQESSDSSAFEISVSNPISEVVGIWLDDGIGGHSTPVTVASYKKGDTTILTSTAMPMNTDYLVTYRGGRLCSFSQSTSYSVAVDISSPSVLIENGSATTRVRAQDGGGGWVRLYANFSSSGGGSAEDSKLITVINPNIANINVSANPTSININETSDIMAKVMGSNGKPIWDGFTVTFTVIVGHGTLSSGESTTVSTVVNNLKLKVSSETRLTLPDIPSSVSGLYLNSSETGFNYITSIETITGNTIILGSDVPIFSLGASVWATYVTAGLAKVLYTAPSTMPSSLENITTIMGMAGSEADVCEVLINNSGAGTGGDGGRGGSSRIYDKWQKLSFSGTHSDYTEEDITLEDTKYLPILDGYLAHWQFGEKVENNCKITGKPTVGGLTEVMCKVKGEIEYIPNKELDINWENLKFSLRVFVMDADNEEGIAGAVVTIKWPDIDNGFEPESHVTTGDIGGLGVVNLGGVEAGWCLFKNAVPFAAAVTCEAEGYFTVETSVNAVSFAPAHIQNSLYLYTEKFSIGEPDSFLGTGAGYVDYSMTLEEYKKKHSLTSFIEKPKPIAYSGFIMFRQVN